MIHDRADTQSTTAPIVHDRDEHLARISDERLTPRLWQGTHWHVIYTDPGAEGLAYASIIAEGFRAFLPFKREFTRRKGYSRSTWQRVPMFKRYIFARFDAARPAWGSLIRLRGVVRVLATPAGKPVPVDTQALEDLRARMLAENGAVSLAQKVEIPSYIKGQVLQVMSGPFAEFMGPFIESTGEEVTILLDLFGMGVKTSVPIKSVRAVDAGA